MKILAFDPGLTTGWAKYDVGQRRLLAAGDFETYRMPPELFGDVLAGDLVAVEGFGAVHAQIHPQTVSAAWSGGRLVERILRLSAAPVFEITRHAVKKALHSLIMGEFPIKKDRDVWASLQLIHGAGSDKKGGPIHGAKAHQRAALAVAVAVAAGVPGGASELIRVTP